MEGNGWALEEVDAEDFNQSLDKLLDIVSNDLVQDFNYDAQTEYTEDEAFWRAHESYDDLTPGTHENNTKRRRWRKAPSIPKIMKNDIRRYYSRMFLNTMNTADLGSLQDYYATFMTGPCQFVAQYATNPEFALPGILVTEGPRLMSHYCLGVFVMYPDMVLSLKDSKIVTSNYWTGSRIVMDIQVDATKMYDIDFDFWIPQLATLTTRYHTALLESMPVQAVSNSDHAAISSAITQELIDDEACAQLLSDVGLHPSCEGQASAEATHGTFQDTSQPPARDTMPTATLLPPGPSELSVYPMQGTPYECTGVVDTGLCKNDTVSCGACCAQNMYIPEAFIRSLFAHAKLLPEPIALQLRGQITMYLDENNHIQHMHLSMEQKNV